MVLRVPRFVTALAVLVTMRANSSVPAISQLSQIDYAIRLLFVFMTVLAQSFFAFVRCHLVAFAFLSVWHVNKILLS